MRSGRGVASHGRGLVPDRAAAERAGNRMRSLVNQVSSSVVVLLDGRWLGTKAGASGTLELPALALLRIRPAERRAELARHRVRTAGVLADGIGAALVGPDTVLRPRFERALLLQVQRPGGIQHRS